MAHVVSMVLRSMTTAHGTRNCELSGINPARRRPRHQWKQQQKAWMAVVVVLSVLMSGATIANPLFRPTAAAPVTQARPLPAANPAACNLLHSSTGMMYPLPIGPLTPAPAALESVYRSLAHAPQTLAFTPTLCFALVCLARPDTPLAI